MITFDQAWGLSDIKDTLKNYPTRDRLWRAVVRTRSNEELNQMLMRLTRSSTVNLTIFDSRGSEEIYEIKLNHG